MNWQKIVAILRKGGFSAASIKQAGFRVSNWQRYCTVEHTQHYSEPHMIWQYAALLARSGYLCAFENAGSFVLFVRETGQAPDFVPEDSQCSSLTVAGGSQ